MRRAGLVLQSMIPHDDDTPHAAARVLRHQPVDRIQAILRRVQTELTVLAQLRRPNVVHFLGASRAAPVSCRAVLFRVAFADRTSARGRPNSRFLP